MIDDRYLAEPLDAAVLRADAQAPELGRSRLRVMSGNDPQARVGVVCEARMKS